MRKKFFSDILYGVEGTCYIKSSRTNMDEKMDDVCILSHESLCVNYIENGNYAAQC